MRGEATTGGLEALSLLSACSAALSRLPEASPSGEAADDVRPVLPDSLPPWSRPPSMIHQLASRRGMRPSALYHVLGPVPSSRHSA